MTTTVRIENLEGNKAVQVDVCDDLNDTENSILLKPSESIDVLVCSETRVVLYEYGDFLV